MNQNLKIFLWVGNMVGNEDFCSIKKGSQQNAESLDSLDGDPTGNRTPVSGVRGQRPNR